jgi:hypothetical protein
VPKKKQKKQQKLLALQSGTPVRDMYLVPDRKTGLQEVEELRRLCPGRIWNFVSVSYILGVLSDGKSQVEVNVPYPVR